MKRNSHLIHVNKSDKRERLVPGHLQGSRHGNEIDPCFKGGMRLPLVDDKKEKKSRG